ncbi:MAG: EAL domain-containing protein [Solirubrobacterales bacterium]
MAILGQTRHSRVFADEIRMLEALLVIDERERVVEWNTAATLLLGYERREVLGHDLGTMIIPAERLPEHRERFASLLRTDSCPLLDRPFPSRVMRSTGERLDVAVRITRTATDPPNFAVSLRETEVSCSDELTRRQMETMLESSEDAMTALTLDGFVTEWNPAAEELYGYTAAEAIGRRLATMIVPEELMHEPLQWLAEVAEGRTVELETRRLRKDRSTLWVSVRMVPVRDPGGSVVGSVMIARDITDRYRLSARAGEEAESARWWKQIRQALVGGGLVLHAQPVFDLRRGTIEHHELLLRMDVGGRLAMPGEFVAHAEASGQIAEIDLFVARRGIELARHRPVAINLSASSFTNEDLLALFVRGLREGPVAPGNLTVEVTESATVGDLEQAVDFAERLVALGCAVSLDDFGTGFGSFTYLNRLPASELKIDREFVRDLGVAEADRRIVDTMVDIAANFGLRTVAEGVEDEAARRYLLSAGVDLAQGHLLGVPEPIDPRGSLSPPPGPRT